MEFLRNDCFSVDGRTYRYLASFPVPPRVYVIDINDPKALPKRWSREYLHELSRPPVKLKRVPTVMPSRPHSERERDLARGHKRYLHVQALLAHEGIYDKLTRGQLLREYSATSGVSTDALLAWLRMWWQRGQMLDALASDYHRSGRITASTEGALAIKVKEQGRTNVTFIAPARGKPRGARPKPAEGYGINKSLRGVGVNASDGTDALPPRYIPYQIADDERLKILGIAWSHYGENRHKSMRGATTRVLAEMYAVREADGSPRVDKDGNYVIPPQGQRPSYRQIQCILNKAKSLSVAYRARHSPAAYANNIQPRYGSVKEDCLGPGDVYDIDATTLDFNCVDRATKQFIIGRPTLYIVSDRWSRLIVGFHLGLDNPSWAEAKLAVMSICADWRAMASRFRVRVTARDLVANGRWPNRFFADRGNDMLVGASDRICDGMETQITNARALRAVSKGIVESEFKGTSTALRQIVPGYLPPEDNRQRRAKPHAKNARLTLDTLRANLFRIVISRNRTHLNGYEASSKEIALGHSLAPVDIWQRGVESMTTYGMRFPYDYVRQKLMSRGRAKVQGDGFSFGQCHYYVPELGEWHVRARLLGTFLVDVSYESSLVDTIVIHDPTDSTKTYVARLTAKDKKWEGYSFAERYAEYRNEKRNRRNSAAANEAEAVALYLDLQELNHKDVEETGKAIEGVSLHAREEKGNKVARPKEEKERRLEAHKLHAPLPQDTSEATDASFEEIVEGARTGQSVAASGVPTSVGAMQAPSTPASGLTVAGGYVLPTSDSNSAYDVAPASLELMRRLHGSVDDDDAFGTDDDESAYALYTPAPAVASTPSVSASDADDDHDGVDSAGDGDEEMREVTVD